MLPIVGAAEVRRMLGRGTGDPEACAEVALPSLGGACATLGETSCDKRAGTQVKSLAALWLSWAL